MAGRVAAGALGRGCDWYLTVFAYRFPFHLHDYLLTWAWYALALVFGRALLSERQSGVRVVGAALLSATSFYLVTNYAVWAMAGSFYPHTLAGLDMCMVAGLPFYRNDVISTTLVVGLGFRAAGAGPAPAAWPGGRAGAFVSRHAGKRELAVAARHGDLGTRGAYLLRVEGPVIAVAGVCAPIA